MTALGIIFHSILNYKLMKPVSILQLPKEKKQAKSANLKKWVRKMSNSLKKMNFSVKTSLVSIVL